MSWLGSVLVLVRFCVILVCVCSLCTFGFPSTQAAADPPDGGAAPLPPFRLGTPDLARGPVDQGTYPLRVLGDGAYLYEDSRFRAHIAPDGHVSFTDLRLRFDVPRLMGVPLARTGGGDPNAPPLEKLTRFLRGDPKQPLPFQLRPTSPHHADPLDALPPLMRLPVGPMFIHVSGSFDLTDELMRATGQGWYRLEKARFLSATFEFRMKMAVSQHRVLVHQALADLPGRLDRLWADPAYTYREKRALLCLLWSEVNVTDPRHRRAADTILDWIAQRLPAGSGHAYSPGEQAACAASAGRPFSAGPRIRPAAPPPPPPPPAEEGAP